MSKASVHVNVGPTGFGAFLQLTAQHNSPVGVVYMVDINVSSDRNNLSPTTKLIYRYQTDAFNRMPTDYLVGDPEQSAIKWMTKDTDAHGHTLIDNWRLNQADWYDPLNAPVISSPAEAAWLDKWMQTALKIAFDNGMKLAMFSFDSGNPSLDLWQYLVPSLTLGKSMGAILSLHGYWDGPSIGSPEWNDSVEWNITRHRKFYPSLPAAAQIPIVYTEASPGNGYGTGPTATGDQWMANMKAIDAMLMADPYVMGFCGFQLGGEESNCSEVMAKLTDYVASTPSPIVPPPPPPPPSGYLSIVYLAPQILSKAENAEFNAIRNAVRGTATQSAGDAVAINKSPDVLPNSKVVVFKPSGWVNSIDDWMKAKGVVNIEHREFSSIVVPWLSQLGATASYAYGDCGTTDIAMILNYRGKAVTVDDVSKASGAPANFLVLDATQLTKAAAAFGLPLVWMANQTIESLRVDITAKQPIVALVNYAALPNRVKRDPNYTRGHWLLVVGVTDTEVIYHDPYEVDESIGAYKTLTWAEFDRAWSTTNADFGIPRQVLRVMQVVVPPPSPSVFAYSGVGQGNPALLSAAELSAFKTSGLSAVKLLTNGDPGDNASNVAAIRAIQPSAFIMGRLFFSVNIPSPFGPQQFVDFVTPGLSALYAAGVRHFEVHNEPNLVNEGLGFNWADGAAFGNWLLGVLSILKPKYPLAKWGYPGLSPQTNVPSFLTASAAAVSACDFVCAHSYWDDGAYPMLSLGGGLSFRTVRDRAMGKLIYVTEFSNNNSAVAADVKGKEYLQYFTALKSEPGVVGAFAFVLSWPGQDVHHEGWVENPGIPQAVGAK